MKQKHPYTGLPDHQFWEKEPAILNAAAFDPVIEPLFLIGKSDPVVTAGSCFAQHVSNYLSQSGFNHLITESAHPMFDKETAGRFNYGTFSARYGNVYTAGQLKQLLLRAYGQFEPVEECWASKTPGFVVDPFRPQIQPDGFVSAEELNADRHRHFSAVREAVENMSVFIFTLGLTECWVDKRDGAIFPLAPGVAGGCYDPDFVVFRNFGLAETVDDLLYSLNFIRKRNQAVRFVLTVSPVPLNATRENRHVFVSTTWSKSVLRVAAEEVTSHIEQCAYFPSYEIITSPFSRGAYFDKDCRTVTQAGVSHVMSLFLRHFGVSSTEGVKSSGGDDAVRREHEHVLSMEKAIDALCDEEAIDNK